MDRAILVGRGLVKLAMVTVTWGLLLASSTASPASAQSVTADVLDVQIVDDELIGIRDGAPATRKRLQRGETVEWRGARGTVGGVLTNRRFLAVSSTSSGWREVRLLRDDGPAQIVLGANVLLCITEKRIIALPGPAGELTEERLGPGESVIESSANEQVAAVVTNRRAFGYSSLSADATVARLNVQEELDSLKVLATTVSLRTTRRLLIFRSSTGAWVEEEA